MQDQKLAMQSYTVHGVPFSGRRLPEPGARSRDGVADNVPQTVDLLDELASGSQQVGGRALVDRPGCASGRDEGGASLRPEFTDQLPRPAFGLHCGAQCWSNELDERQSPPVGQV